MPVAKLFTLTLLVASVALGACDRSKVELDATRQQLQTLASERENLKTQLDASKHRELGLQQQVTELQGRLSAAVAALVPPEVPTQSAAGKVDKKAADQKSGDAPKPGAAKTGEPGKAPAL